MLKLKNQTKISAIALILVFTISAVIVAIPSATAQAAQETYPFLGVVPNPVGVNQWVLFHVGIFQQLYAAKMGWEGLYITIERPDGQIDTISDIKTDSTGGTGKTYLPTETGLYICTAHFPEQATRDDNYAPGIPIGTVMLASESAPVELVVQEEAIQYYPGHSLPQEYWTRPIDAQLREWAAVTGNWLEASFTAPIVLAGNEEAPETAHILWTKEMTLGGIAGMEGVAQGAATDQQGPEWSFSHGDAYEGKWTSRLIIDGILIYNHRTNDRPVLYTAVDVRTGEELWTKTILDNRTISFAQNLRWGGYNHHAVYAYFWVTIGSTWYAFDPYTGNQEFTVTNVPSGTTQYDENGWLYRVNLNYRTGEGYIWSMVDMIEPFGSNSPAPGSWLPAGSFYGTRYAIYNASDVDPITGEPTEATQRAYISEFTFQSDPQLNNVRAMALGDKVFGLQYSQTEIITWALSLESGKEGDLLFYKTWNAPAWWAEGNIQIEFNCISLKDGAAVFWVHDTLQYYCFSTDTGNYMWGPAEPEYYMNYYGWTELGERPPFIWEGKLYSSGAGGVIYCYDLTDGTVLWSYEATDPYQEYLFANNWWQFFLFIVDGKLYSAHMEHSAIEPMPRGAPFYCFNATTGDVIWEADGLFRSTRWGGRGIMGDSVMVGMDTYDNRLYAVGKGASVLTVESAQAAEVGSSVTIQGTVMDVSPGCLSDTNLQIRFPNGVPAVSDASQSAWMLYVWKNFERPADATGVPVRLELVGPDMSFTELGTATSDSYGNFAFGFCPENAGTYMIIATFTGSGAYYGSTQTTYLTVSEAAALPPPCDLTGVEDSIANQTTYLLVLIVLVIIALLLAIYAIMKSRK
jgi:outer membrane protein assembly factor BamB